MNCPGNALYILKGETNMILTAIKKPNPRWSSHVQQDAFLLKSFINLKDSINHASGFEDLNPVEYLSPFLDVIRSETTSGALTCYGLSAVHKFISYGFIDVESSYASVVAENIADAVTHARFMGTDASCDEVVLVKIIQVLHLLLFCPLGKCLTNYSVCELIQSFFRICFELRFSEILRQIGESALVDTVQLLFSSLPQFPDDLHFKSQKELKFQSCNFSKGSFYRRKHNLSNCVFLHPNNNPDSNILLSSKSNSTLCSQPEISIASRNVKMYEKISENRMQIVVEEQSVVASEMSIPTSVAEDDILFELPIESPVADLKATSEIDGISDTESVAAFPKSCTGCPVTSNNPTTQPGRNNQDEEAEGSEITLNDCHESSRGSESVPSFLTSNDADYINPRGIRFTLDKTPNDGCGSLEPYGLPCVREILKLLISLINPQDQHNTEQTIQIGLNLITIALEVGADNLGKFTSLIVYIQDDLCKNLLALLATSSLTIFSSCLRVFLLLFEALRTHLKFQLEIFLLKLMEIITSDSSKTLYEQQHMSLDCLVQLWRIPGFVTEVFVNYDCDLHSSNLLEDITELLSKNAYPLSELYSVHVLSLDGLVTIIDTIENNCRCRVLSERKSCVAGPQSSNEPVMPQATSGSGQQPLVLGGANSESPTPKKKVSKRSLYIKPNRMYLASDHPNREELMAIKHKKKILLSGIEQFNCQPTKGISFLQDHELLKSPLDAQEVAMFLRHNPQLDKKMIGDYISNGKNLTVLESFVKSFAFQDSRIDEALRQFLETFRLPGEAPLISLIMEHFAEHWHKSNNVPFANTDAAFTLAYAVIMLNVDQHNHNAKRQNIPMTLEDFKKNLKGVNGDEDFDEDMLENIYCSIRLDEIVMPAEHIGLVRENYLWKVLLRRGNTEEGKFIHVPNGIFDNDLFALIWGPTVAALSFVFDKSNNPGILKNIIVGFHECATIAAHYKMCKVFDSIIISLCKFTSLVNVTEDYQSLAITFGSNKKAQMATKAAFRLANLHRDILKEGWKNLLDCILNLFNARLLPQDLIEAEDFLNPNGVISLVREDLSIRRTESGLFSSFYSYITSDTPSQRLLPPEDEVAKCSAVECIKECHCEQLITESKFFKVKTLQELVKTLIFLCRCPEPNASSCNISFDEDLSVFVLELLVKIVLLNRDRVLTIWSGIQDHLFCLVMNSAITGKTYLLERSVVGILRIAVRLARKEEMMDQVIKSLQGLLFLKSAPLMLVSRQAAHALHELLRTNATNIHSKDHWSVIFSLLERVGAGVKLTSQSHFDADFSKDHFHASESSGVQSDGESFQSEETDFTFDTSYASCNYESKRSQSISQDTQYAIEQIRRHSENFCGQIASVPVNKEGAGESCHAKLLFENYYNVVFSHTLASHDSLAFLKTFKSLAFLVQDIAYITNENFESCVHCLQTFIEASANGGNVHERIHTKRKGRKEKKWTRGNSKWKEVRSKRYNSLLHKSKERYDDDDDEAERCNDLSLAYQQVSIQLLDFAYTLYTRASSIFGSLASQSEVSMNLWRICWCPLLQGIARLCCDTRRLVRTSALNLLPRALLMHDLQSLTSAEWEACFNEVLFPLLAKLLDDINHDDPIGMEETRMRGATLLCKVFLQHLTPLLELSTFTTLWSTILYFMNTYMQADQSGLLAEAIPESLKNMLLVMNTAGVFKKSGNTPMTENDRMWDVTWTHINSFLPSLQKDFLKSPESRQTSYSNGTCDVKSHQETKQPIETSCANGGDSNFVQKEKISPSAPLVIDSIGDTSPDSTLPTPVSVILQPPVIQSTYTQPIQTESYCPQLEANPAIISSDAILEENNQ